jgi:hypothetical protein
LRIWNSVLSFFALGRDRGGDAGGSGVRDDEDGRLVAGLAAMDVVDRLADGLAAMDNERLAACLVV